MSSHIADNIYQKSEKWYNPRIGRHRATKFHMLMCYNENMWNKIMREGRQKVIIENVTFWQSNNLQYYLFLSTYQCIKQYKGLNSMNQTNLNVIAFGKKNNELLNMIAVANQISNKQSISKR